MPGTAGERRISDDARLVVGLVRGLHGLRGAVRVEVLSDDAARFEPGSVVYLEGDSRPLTVVWVQQDGPGLLIRFRELTTRDAAEGLRDVYLVADAPGELPEGNFYWHEIVGSAVRTSDGEDLGVVEDVFRAGGGEVFVARGSRRGEVLVPAVQGVVLEFQPRDGRITVDRDALALDDVEPPRPRGRRSSKRDAVREPTGDPAANATAGPEPGAAEPVAPAAAEPAAPAAAG